MTYGTLRLCLSLLWSATHALGVPRDNSINTVMYYAETILVAAGFSTGAAE